MLCLRLEQLNLSFTIFPDTRLGDGGSIVRLSTNTQQQAARYGTTFGNGFFLLQALLSLRGKIVLQCLQQ